MKVSKLNCPESKRIIFRVYGENSLPHETINEFLRHQEKRDMAPNTIKANAFDLIVFFNYLSSLNQDWSTLNPGILVDFVYHLRHSSSELNIYAMPSSNLTRSEKTISRIMSSVLSFCRYQYYTKQLLVQLEESGVLARSNSPIKGFLSFAKSSRSYSTSFRKPTHLTKFRVRKTKPKTISDEECELFLKACSNSRDRLLVMLLLETGMRAGQVLQLKHEDIESWNSRLKVTYRLDNPNEVYAKSRDDYYIDLSCEWINLYTEYLINDIPHIESEFVFTSHYSNNPSLSQSPYTYPALKDMFRRVSHKAGLHVTPHMLRHTHATALLREGVPIEIVSRRLGHKSIETTMSTYEHLTSQDMRQAIDEAKRKYSAIEEESNHE